ncbi:hypothetical protein [Halobacteriovorax sp. DPLXC-1]|uniref:hypothetical protein n=1 Tax=Halobacteriovorax sp. DPLXC-1 TaxID=3110771 RepID=UPI002FF164BF
MKSSFIVLVFCSFLLFSCNSGTGDGGYSYMNGGPAPGGSFGAFIKAESYSFLASGSLVPTVISKIAEEFDAEELQ